MDAEQTNVEQPKSQEAFAQGWRRVMLLSLAGICFAVGVVGVFLPILPTTPFLLLTSYFLVRTSPRLHAALMRSRLFGPILRDWQLRGGVRKRVKRNAIIAVTVAVALTIWLSDYSLKPTIAVSLLALVGVTVIARLPVVGETHR